MDFHGPARNRLLPAWGAAVAVAAMLAGCSSAANELRTPAQSAGFVAATASGEHSGQWKLASDASRQAAQAWAARATIEDLGQMLRNAKRLPRDVSRGEPTWTCEMARKLIALGAYGVITSFNNDDIEIVTKEAVRLGIEPNEVAALIHDASTVPFRDLALATAAVCGPLVS